MIKQPSEVQDKAYQILRELKKENWDLWSIRKLSEFLIDIAETHSELGKVE